MKKNTENESKRKKVKEVQNVLEKAWGFKPTKIIDNEYKYKQPKTKGKEK